MSFHKVQFYETKNQKQAIFSRLKNILPGYFKSNICFFIQLAIIYTKSISGTFFAVYSFEKQTVLKNCINL